jgi:hypothetical protein
VIGLLSDLIAKNPTQVLGKAVVAKFGPNLPFLLKVYNILLSDIAFCVLLLSLFVLGVINSAAAIVTGTS